MTQSDPLKTISASPAKAPDWRLSRVVSTQDSVFTKRADGVSSSDFNAVRFAVTPMTADPTRDPAAEPGGAANPSVEIRVWSAQAKAFVPMSTPLARAGAGAGTPYVVDVPAANGSVVACFVTNAIGAHVAIAAQGCEIGGTAADAAAAGGNTVVDVASLPPDVQTDIDAIATATGASATFLSTLAGAVLSGSIKAVLQTGSAAIGKLAANVAGVLIGMVEVAAPAVGFNGQITVTTGITSVAINGGTSQAVRGATLSCDIGSAGHLLVDIRGTAVGTNLQSVGDRVYPGHAKYFEIDNLNKVTVGASANGSTGTWNGS